MALGPSPVPVDEIIRLSGASSGAMQRALLEFDLAGWPDPMRQSADRLTSGIHEPHLYAYA
jgi:DprA winged helix domain